MTRSPAQKPAHKDPESIGQNPANKLRPTYAPVSNRAGSRSSKKDPVNMTGSYLSVAASYPRRQFPTNYSRREEA
ncbi:hypothetical protein DB326_13805 [Lacticaseibacillus casei]|nr:hypothetical protein DB326_13805 [Lacticaseibacillus casei]